MFYSFDLLSLRRRGELSYLWHAGIMTRKQFCTKFDYRNVRVIAVATLGDKVIDHLRSGDANRRLSLLVSSKLLLGASRILNYQADMALSAVRKFWINSLPPAIEKRKKKKGAAIPRDEVYAGPEDLPEVPDFTQNLVDDPHLITIQESDPLPSDKMLDNMLAFGSLTEEDMERIRAPDARPFDEELFKPVPDSPPRQFPSPRGATDPVVVEPSEKETREPDSTVPLPTDDVPPPTPKRKPTSPAASGTPTKRRHVTEPEDTIPVAQPVRQQNEPLIFGSLDSSNVPTGPRKKRRQMIDEVTTLSSTSMREHLGNNFFLTKPRELPNPKPKTDWFNIPTTQVAWGKAILTDYQIMITEPIPRDTDQTPPDGPPRHETTPQNETEDISGNIVVPTTDGSSNVDQGESIPRNDQNGQIELPPVIEDPNGETAPEVPTLPDDDPRASRLPDTVPGDIHKIVTDFFSTGASKITGASPSRRTEIGPVDSGSEADSVYGQLDIAKLDILGRLEVLWAENDVVHITDLCAPEDSNRYEAAQTFALVVVLHTEEKIVATQDFYCGPINIKKLL